MRGCAEEREQQQRELEAHRADRSGMEQQVEQHEREAAGLHATVKEDQNTKRTVQDIIYDIEREARAEIGRLRSDCGRKEAELVKLRQALEQARLDMDELKAHNRQLESESGKWTCRSCTFVNHARNRACEMCGVDHAGDRRPVVARAVPAEGSGGGFAGLPTAAAAPAPLFTQTRGQRER